MCWGPTLYDLKINPIISSRAEYQPQWYPASEPYSTRVSAETTTPSLHSHTLDDVCTVYADARDADYLIYDCRPWRLPSACGLSRRHRLYLITKSRVRGYSSGKATRYLWGYKT